MHYLKTTESSLIRLCERVNNNKVICNNQVKVFCSRSGSHGKVKQNDKLRPVQDSGSLAVFKVTARDQGHYKGPSGAFVRYCNIFCFIFIYFVFVCIFCVYKILYKCESIRADIGKRIGQTYLSA